MTMNKYRALIKCQYYVDFVADADLDDDELAEIAEQCENYELYHLHDFECDEIEVLEEDVREDEEED